MPILPEADPFSAAATPAALSLRARLQALAAWQAGTPAEHLPREDAAAMAQPLAGFAGWAQQMAPGRPWGVAEQAAWARVQQALIDSALAQPAVALQGGGCAGPLLHDVAALLRPQGVQADEAQELDEAIRWWEAARRAGLPVPADFGECWRALEWLALQRHLAQLPQCAPGKETAALLAAVGKVALRYGPLKPLLRLLPAQPGAEVGAGYTF